MRNVKVLVIGEYHYDEAATRAIASLIKTKSKDYHILYGSEHVASSLNEFEKREKEYVRQVTTLFSASELENPIFAKISNAIDRHPRMSKLTENEKNSLISDLLKYRSTKACIEALIPLLKEENIQYCFMGEQEDEEQINTSLQTISGFDILIKLEQKRMNKAYNKVMNELSSIQSNKPILVILHCGIAHVQALINRFSQNSSMDVYGCKLYSEQLLSMAPNIEEILNGDTEKPYSNSRPVSSPILLNLVDAKQHIFFSDAWKEWLENSFKATLPKISFKDMASTFPRVFFKDMFKRSAIGVCLSSVMSYSEIVTTNPITFGVCLAGQYTLGESCFNNNPLCAVAGVALLAAGSMAFSSNIAFAIGLSIGSFTLGVALSYIGTEQHQKMLARG